MDLWTEATYNYDAHEQAKALEMAKAASQGTWGFLSLASSQEEFSDRIALASKNIVTTANETGVPVGDLLNVFQERFALLMEARDNPFADNGGNDDSGDSKDDDSSDSHDDSHDDNDDDDDSHDDGGDGNDDDSDSGNDDSDDDDSDDSGNDSSDSDQDNGDDHQDDNNSAPPWANKFSVLAQRIDAGENPLNWGGTPFVRSPVRSMLAGRATDMSEQEPAGPQGEAGEPDGAPQQSAGPQAPMVPGMEGGIAETTKPRQLPAGGGGADALGMGMDGITNEFDPVMNGGDIEQGGDSPLPGESAEAPGKSAMVRKIDTIASEIKRYNPALANDECYSVASRVYDQYLSKQAEDVNPLLYGDRAAVGDGPLSGPLKNWSPKDMKPSRPPIPPDGGGMPGAPKLPAGGGAGGAGGEGAVAGEAGELLPLLAL